MMRERGRRGTVPGSEPAALVPLRKRPRRTIWVLLPLVGALLSGLRTAAAAAHLLRVHTRLNDTVQIEPWGTNALRVRIALDGLSVRDDLPGALIRPGSDNKGWPVSAATGGRGRTVTHDTVQNGNIVASVSAQGLVTIKRVDDGTVLLSETGRGPAPSATYHHGNASFAVPAVFEAFVPADHREQLFGFGEHQRSDISLLNQSFSMEACLEYKRSHGGAVCIPFVLGAWAQRVQYGFLWNVPAYGGANFSYSAAGQPMSARRTTWVAQATTQLDYFVVTPGTSVAVDGAAQIMHAFADAVGHAPPLPPFASGYWHSKNRYESSDQLLDVARGFVQRGINVSVLVVDFHHWVHM
jgi:alpha-D-xyloside xylohydrolase